MHITCWCVKQAHPHDQWNAAALDPNQTHLHLAHCDWDVPQVSFMLLTCQSHWTDSPWTFLYVCVCVCTLVSSRCVSAGTLFRCNPLAAVASLSTGAAVNSSESLPPSSSINDISSMSTDQTQASDTDSSLETSAGPLGCCRWLAACLRNPTFFRRWRTPTGHDRLRKHTQQQQQKRSKWVH